MWCKDDTILAFEKRRITRWLIFKDIERCSGDAAVLDRFGQGGFVNDAAPGCVDDAHAWLHSGQHGTGDEVRRLASLWRVHRNIIGITPDLLERDAGHVQLLGLLDTDHRIVNDHFHPQRLGCLSDATADFAEADHTKSFVEEFAAYEFAALPFAALE